MRTSNPVRSGAVAQLGERLVRNEEATGSIPVSSTIVSISYDPPKAPVCPTLSQNKARRGLPEPQLHPAHVSRSKGEWRREHSRQADEFSHNLLFGPD